VADGPDFLCIGLQKAGTGWLYDQLQFHPDFWMTAVKELHVLDRSFPNKRIHKAIVKTLADLEGMSASRFENDWRQLDERDRDFFEQARDCIGKPSDLDRYASLFRQKGDLLSGDITPSYGGIDESEIDVVVARFPKVKALILLRDPVQRVMSQIGMAYRNQKAPEVAFRKLEPFKDFFLQGPFGKRSFATQIVQKWKSRLPDDQFAFYFFDDIVGRPEGLRSDVLTFLGGDPAKSSRLAADFNRKSRKSKLVLPDEIQVYLQDYFREELERSVEMFGGHAKAWLTRYHGDAA
jgi:hypothetical protein